MNVIIIWKNLYCNINIVINSYYYISYINLFEFLFRSKLASFIFTLLIITSNNPQQ